MSTIVLTGGGTAGHCTPNLALIPYLKKDFNNIYYIGSKNGIEKKIINKTDIPYFSVNTIKFKRKFSFRNLLIPFILITGIIQAGKILDKLKPDIIFSKGGYVALPVIFAAKKRKIPIISHESDFSIGLTNKISSKYCLKVLTAFPETAKHVKHGEYSGNPLRKDLFNVSKEQALSFFNLNGQKPVLLVTGGSLGAKILNDTIRNSLSELLSKYDIIHICGKGNLNKKLNQTGYIQKEFTEMEKAYSASDICLSRAGSNTIFELLALNIPSLLVPLPKGISRGDQILNAEYFQKKGLVSVLPQDALTKESLLLYINSLFLNKSTIKRNLKNYGIKDESRNISRIIYDCANSTQP